MGRNILKKSYDDEEEDCDRRTKGDQTNNMYV